MATSNKRDLSPGRKQLVEIMQRTNYGRVERLRVRDGEPLLDPMPRIVKTIKLAGANGARAEVVSDDFALKREVLDLFAHFDAMRNGIIPVIDVRHGLPFVMEVEVRAVE